MSAVTGMRGAVESARLAIGLGRVSAARGETLLVVAPSDPGAVLLERVHDARRAGATVLTPGAGDRELGTGSWGPGAGGRSPTRRWRRRLHRSSTWTPCSIW